MWDTVLDALIDSAKVLPFLFLIYVLIEFLETNEKARLKTVKLLNGKAAPLVASGVGLIPQCGFSVMASDLYAQNYIRTGTLIAFFVATSDEALPILLTDSSTIKIVWIVLVIKLVYALLLGYLINAFARRPLAAEYSATEHDEGCCHHDMHQKKTFWQFIKHPLVHTLKIFIYIFLVNVAFGLLLYFAEDSIMNFMSMITWAQPFVAALIGLIPNCGSSVVITGMYSSGIITFGAMCAGLVSNSGIALAVLLKDKRHVRRNLLILAVLYAAGAVAGLAITWLIPL